MYLQEIALDNNDHDGNNDDDGSSISDDDEIDSREFDDTLNINTQNLIKDVNIYLQQISLDEDNNDDINKETTTTAETDIETAFTDSMNMSQASHISGASEVSTKEATPPMSTTATSSTTTTARASPTKSANDCLPKRKRERDMNIIMRKWGRPNGNDKPASSLSITEASATTTTISVDDSLIAMAKRLDVAASIVSDDPMVSLLLLELPEAKKLLLGYNGMNDKKKKKKQHCSDYYYENNEIGRAS